MVASDWRPHVSQSRIHTGWYAFLVRARAEEKVKKWLELQLKQTGSTQHGLAHALIPMHSADVVTETQANEQKTPLCVLFVKPHQPEDIDRVLGGIDYREKQRVGIRKVFPVQDIEVYKMMDSSESTLVSYKINDTVMIKNADDQIEYQIFDIIEDGTVARLATYLFNQKVITERPVGDLVRVDRKKDRKTN
jgi:hypothetical protein